jgi:hypothetical protein
MIDGYNGEDTNPSLWRFPTAQATYLRSIVRVGNSASPQNSSPVALSVHKFPFLEVPPQ